MTTVRVRAEQATVDWERGSEFEVERTPFVDRLITDGRLTVLDSASQSAAENEGLDTEPGLPIASSDEPPRAGKGSGLAQWRDFLDRKGVEYSDDASRDDLIAVWDEHVARVAKAQADLQSARAEAWDAVASLNAELGES
ncbi:hypothetical protein [Rhodococcus sp. AG1013]|uniref:hypothetical protein n=1 Tax=Rhodococcus sp. AG1013 TaxID=2183996 RepID=UPI000E0B651B|nr:hypothetical protein [Rhodococcus sp. AG1013]